MKRDGHMIGQTMLRLLISLLTTGAILAAGPGVAKTKDAANGWGAGQVEVTAPGSAQDPAYAAFEKRRYMEAKKLAEKIAEKDGPSNVLLGMIYEQGLGVPQDQTKAAEIYLRGAQLGDPHAQFAVGVMLAEGRGITQNKAQAARFFEMAAAQNHDTALYNLALIYVEGDARPEDLEKAAELMERSAKLGNIAAQFDLAAIYKTGRGVRLDERKAAYWIGKAAETGMSNAELEYGIALYLGKGVKKDEAKGFKMIRSSAEKGNPVAQNRLAHAYVGGLGVEKDWVAAAKWHLLSRQAGVSDFALDKFLASLTPEERKKAEKSAYDWEQQTSALLQ